MDTRVQRSKKKIVDSFIKLRSKKSLERITVAELCRNADINKSTFYAHYRDIYDLSDQIENSIIQDIISSISHPADIIEDQNIFIKELFAAFSDKRKQINILFSGTRSVLLPQKIEFALREVVYNIHPEYKGDPKINIMLCYKIYGGFYTFLENEKHGADFVASVIGSLSKN